MVAQERVAADAALRRVVDRWLDDMSKIKGPGQFHNASQVLDWIHGASAFARELGVIDDAGVRALAAAAESGFLAAIRSGGRA